MMKSHLVLLAVALASAVPQSAHAADNRLQVTPELRERAAGVVRQVFNQEQEFVKVHAAEYLLALGCPEGVKEAFAKEMDLHGKEPGYRIGIWRVLSRTANDDRERAGWIGKIRDVFLDPAASDRGNAAESLAKLCYELRDEDLATVERIAQSDNAAMVPNALGILVNSKRPGAEDRLAELLASSAIDTRLDTAYVIRHLRSVAPATQEKLLAAAKREPTGSKARVFLVAAAGAHAPPDARVLLRADLAAILSKGSDDEKFEAVQTLGQIGEASDLSRIIPLLDDPTPDVRATAAAAILQIDRRTPRIN
jgi:HEAT repeat protein